MEENHRALLGATLPHLDAVYRVARYAGIGSWQPEDLVQETYLRAFAGFTGHTGPSTRAWLITICLHVARSEGRRRSRRVAEQTIGDGEDLRPSGTDVFAEVQAGLDSEAVHRALQSLPTDQRLAIVLMDLNGFTAAEVAEMLSRPRGTILARGHLRERVFRGCANAYAACSCSCRAGVGCLDRPRDDSDDEQLSEPQCRLFKGCGAQAQLDLSLSATPSVARIRGPFRDRGLRIYCDG